MGEMSEITTVIVRTEIVGVNASGVIVASAQGGARQPASDCTEGLDWERIARQTATQGLRALSGETEGKRKKSGGARSGVETPCARTERSAYGNGPSGAGDGGGGTATAADLEVRVPTADGDGGGLEARGPSNDNDNGR